MNTFLNIYQEFYNMGTEWNQSIIKIRDANLNEKINQRGEKEQYASILLTHYYAISNRKRRSTHIKNSKFYSILSFNLIN